MLPFVPPDAEDDMMLDAAEDNDSESIETLLQAPPRSPNVADKDGWTPLSSAAIGGHAGVMRLLLKASAAKDARALADGADTNKARTHNGCTHL